MPSVTVTNNLGDLAKAVQLDQKAQRIAAQRALNVAARGLKTDAGRELRKRYWQGA